MMKWDSWIEMAYLEELFKESGLDRAGQRFNERRRWMLEWSSSLLGDDDNARYDGRFWHFGDRGIEQLSGAQTG